MENFNDLTETQREFIVETLSGVYVTPLYFVRETNNLEESFYKLFGFNLNIDTDNFYILLDVCDLEQCESCYIVDKKDNGFGSNEDGEVCCSDCL